MSGDPHAPEGYGGGQKAGLGERVYEEAMTQNSGTAGQSKASNKVYKLNSCAQ